jgi:DNA polymerase-3 subunit delta'
MFAHLVGNNGAKAVLRRMLETNRVPSALLFAGEEGVGKSLFALELAKSLNCRQPQNGEACSVCASCQRIARISSNETDADDKILWTEHRDVGLIAVTGRTIKVSLVRELERETEFRPVEGRARVFIVRDAHKLNDASSNALLKTLEETPPTTHIILITSRPATLLPTILSRCQAVRFAPLAPEEIEKFLIANKKRAGEDARLAARIARGRLGAALELNLDEYRQDREQMLEALRAIAGDGRGNHSTPDRARLLRIAEDLTDAKRKDDYETRLDILETLTRDVWLLALDEKSQKLVNEDIRPQLLKLARAIHSPRRLAAWLEQIETLRAQLAVNINRRIATDALFLTMAGD